MHPYTTTPRSRDRLSVVLCLVFAVLAIGAFYLSAVLPAYGSLAQAAGLIFLTGTVYIMARNRIPYSYTVEQESDGQTWDLVIARTMGKQRITLCRLAMKDVREIDLAIGETRKSLQRKYHGKTVHNYCPTLFPEQSLYLVFEDSDPYAVPTATEEETLVRRGEEIILHIAYDEVILKMLRETIK
ncbi:MAG: hypothetical protein IJW40_11515 [Clostridia bacterium]|nr:hypothetical protein [Clostridia bacterium]